MKLEDGKSSFTLSEARALLQTEGYLRGMVNELLLSFAGDNYIVA